MSNKLVPLANLYCNECGSSRISVKDFNYLVEKYINDIQEDCSVIEVDGNGSPWCYLTQFTGTNDVEDRSDIPAYLEAVSQCAGEGLIQFSVTSNEGNYKDWLECLGDVPGHNIIKLNRGSYDVFLCTFPVNPDKAFI